jgi:hypothetical protein
MRHLYTKEADALGSWHNEFGMTNRTKTYLRSQLVQASSFIIYTNL